MCNPSELKLQDVNDECPQMGSILSVNPLMPDATRELGFAAERTSQELSVNIGSDSPLSHQWQQQIDTVIQRRTSSTRTSNCISLLS
jgi:hypothetical protein